MPRKRTKRPVESVEKPPDASTTVPDKSCICGLPDEAETNMVQCERCNRYYHFACANVNESIGEEGRIYVCTICTKTVGGNSRTTSSRSGRSTASSAKARAALELQRLEEEREMEKRYLAKKYDILQQQIEEEGSIKSRRSRRSTQRVQDWVASHLVPTSSTGIGSLQIPAGIPSRIENSPAQASSVSALPKAKVHAKCGIEPASSNFECQYRVITNA